MIKELIDQGIDVNEYAFIESALEGGYYGTVSLLLEEGATVLKPWYDDEDAIYRYSDSPLCKQIRAGKRDMVELILRKGVDVRKDERDDGRILWNAMDNASNETFEWLLELGVSPDKPVSSWEDGEEKDYTGLTPFHIAVLDRKPAHAMALYEFGANLELSSTSQAFLDIYEYGGDINFEWVHRESNQLGCTPLLLAVATLQYELFELLVSMGANLLASPADVLYNKGRTALHVAAAVLEDDAVWVQLYMMNRMLEAGADVNAPDADGCTPLHYAVRCGNLTAIEFLLDHGASIAARARKHDWFWGVDFDFDLGGEDGFTPLFYALLREQKEAFRLLLSRGAGWEDRDDMGRTVLHLCCHPEVDGGYLGMVVADGRLVEDSRAMVVAGEREVEGEREGEGERVERVGMGMEMGMEGCGSLIDVVDCYGNTPLHIAGKSCPCRLSYLLFPLSIYDTTFSILRTYCYRPF